MPKKSLEILTEAMFYVLMALRRGPLCGAEIVERIASVTGGRLAVGPATLYTILSKFETEKLIRETATEGRKRSYAITARGLEAYGAERERLEKCLSDALREEETL